MLTLKGSSALSSFRRDKLSAQLRSHIPNLHQLSTQYWHFIDVEGQLNSDEYELLEALMRYGAHHGSFTPKGEMLLVVPRTGTISAWSTKASEIARCCGLSKVIRVERGIAWFLDLNGDRLNQDQRAEVAKNIHDPMTESVLSDLTTVDTLFHHPAPQPLTCVDVISGGIEMLRQANQSLGLALSDDEVSYLFEHFTQMARNPTDVELMMFAQINSEHCRHKIFNADWKIDGSVQPHSLFAMIRETHRQNSAGTIVAYSDNAAVIEGLGKNRWFIDPESRIYQSVEEPVHIVAKVETHNHPTAISPFAGAATGSGGEIRDEGATGRGAKPKAGVTGYSVSNLFLERFPQPWERQPLRPQRIASAQQIMLEAPIGGASFNNEFGRPNIGGYFRTFETLQPDAPSTLLRGYHKPIMLAGGLGNIRAHHVTKNKIPEGAYIIVLGGPAMLIGLGGGAASSMSTGASSEELDFASVQRSNPEMQRRCQEVIDYCWALGDENPIASIHDVGAGGLSNALPELIDDSDRGGQFELRDILSDDSSMTPAQIWCNESQERYVVAVSLDQLDQFEEVCRRERCLYSVVGKATSIAKLIVTDRASNTSSAAKFSQHRFPIDIEMQTLFGKPPKMTRDVDSQPGSQKALNVTGINIVEAGERILRLPGVADKTFLISIGDRSVSGLIHRDQMVGPWQVPVADVAVTISGFNGQAGEAMAIGERPPLALIDPAASGRIAVAEAITNLAAANISDLSKIKLSANWMAAAGFDGEDAALYATVKAVALELCPALGISIPVGKDSMSMQTVWQDDSGADFSVVAPLSLIVTAFAPVNDVRLTLTPCLQVLDEPTDLLLIDLGGGKNRLGGSALAQVYNQLGNESPDVDDPQQLAAFFSAVQELNSAGLILAYHDRSDGGLFVTVLEMAFAGRVGLQLELGDLGKDELAVLYAEELGAVMQIRRSQRSKVIASLTRHGLQGVYHVIGEVTSGPEIEFKHESNSVIKTQRTDLHRIWAQTSWHMQTLRDNPECAQQEYDRILDVNDPGLSTSLTFNLDEDISAPYINKGNLPLVAILREQGVNGQLEMAAAFHQAGFSCVDVTTTDLLSGRESLQRFHGLAACGGFSFGDVLGAGEGWAKSILYTAKLSDQFSQYFSRSDTFTLGVCNGCQMLSGLQSLIPGSEDWPRFVGNLSEQFEARVSMVEVTNSTSVLFNGMIGSKLPVVVAHGEGRVEFSNAESSQRVIESHQLALRYVDNYGEVATRYPYNPNGSVQGITGITSKDGRVTLLMPHPERVFRTVSNSWYPEHWNEYSPWMRLFRNARVWVG